MQHSSSSRDSPRRACPFDHCLDHSIMIALNQTTHSARFHSAFLVLTMQRRSLCLLKLCLLCAALARGVGIPFAPERATLRPPDAQSTNDGFVHATTSQPFNCAVWRLDRTVEKQPPALTDTPPHFSTEPVHNVGLNSFTTEDAERVSFARRGRTRGAVCFSLTRREMTTHQVRVTLSSHRARNSTRF